MPARWRQGSTIRRILVATNFEDGIEDVQDAVSSGRQPRDHGPYGVLIGDAALDFTPAVFADPVPTGRQILSAKGVHDPLEFLVLQWLVTGELIELRLDETVDLRSAGVERFIVFRTDRSFRISLDNQVLEWGASQISGRTLKKLGGLDPSDYEVWLDTRGAADRVIGDRELIDLAAPGVEKFYTIAKSITVVVNARPYQVRETSLTFLAVVRLPFPDAVISETRIYTVTYKRGPAANPEGTLVDGAIVQIKNGMAFNVLFSDKS
jgi:hypothetical protein